MRKIITKEEREKGDRRNQIIIGGVLIFVMLFSVLAYAFGNKEEEGLNKKINYAGIDFVQDSLGYWSFNIQLCD